MTVSCFFFFFSSRRRHTRLVSDWSSDVCSSDLLARPRNVKRSDNYNGEPVNAVQVGEGHFTSELANGVLEPNADFREDYHSITFVTVAISPSSINLTARDFAYACTHPHDTVGEGKAESY